MMDKHLQSFELDLLTALSQTPKHISPKYFYDAEGSVLFDQICDLPEYYPTRTELSILQTHAADMAQHMGANAELIELGAGSLTKVRYLLREMDAPVAFLPMDISGAHLNAAVQDLRLECPQLQITPLVADYTRHWSLPSPRPETARRIAFFPGSTLGNFSPAEVQQFFAHCVNYLPGGALLLGVDLLKAPHIIHQAYNDAQGVTAAFNLNLLARANRELKTNFVLGQFAHWAFYNAPLHRIEMHLVSLKKQEVQVADQVFVLEEGETLHTENSYKFSIDRIQQLALSQGLTAGPVWADAQRWFGLLWLNIPDRAPSL
jgi:dimethylhistidine N-methyltransferase